MAVPEIKCFQLRTIVSSNMRVEISDAEKCGLRARVSALALAKAIAHSSSNEK
jgi:hypothetical protein